MRGFLLLVCASAVAAASAEPVAPTAEQVEQWAAFPKPVNLKAEDVSKGWTESGKLVWYYSYKAKDDPVSVYGVALYKAGGLHGERRAEVEKSVIQMARIVKESADTLRDQAFQDETKYTKVETRPDGRKVFFMKVPIPDDVVSVEVFTTIGKYDVLLRCTIMGRDGGKARPTAELSEIFKKLEKHIGDGK